MYVMALKEIKSNEESTAGPTMSIYTRYPDTLSCHVTSSWNGHVDPFYV